MFTLNADEVSLQLAKIVPVQYKVKAVQKPMVKGWL